MPGRRGPNSSALRDNRVHQSRDRAVQRFVRTPHLLDPVDGVQHRAVVPAAKLAPDFLERRARELPSNVHGDLAREDVRAAIGAHRELRVAHLPQVEVLAHHSADCLDRWLQCRRIKDRRRCWCAPFGTFVPGVLGCGLPDDGDPT